MLEIQDTIYKSGETKGDLIPVDFPMYFNFHYKRSCIDYQKYLGLPRQDRKFFELIKNKAFWRLIKIRLVK